MLLEQKRSLERMGELQEAVFSVAFCSPAKSFTFSGLMETPLVGKKVKF